MFGGGADGNGIGLSAHERKLAQARDIDELRGAREPHRHQRHQCLSACDETRVVRCRGEHCTGLIQIGGTEIFKRGGFHPSMTVGRITVGCQRRAQLQTAARSDDFPNRGQRRRVGLRSAAATQPYVRSFYFTKMGSTPQR